MLHEECETEVPRSALPRVVASLPAPVCLLGGWAVYYTVNARYRSSTGMEYHGSRDIDLGFHLERDATARSMRESALAKSIEALKEGFRSTGARLFREHHRETRMILSEARAKKTPSYNIFQLYVDVLVDNAPRGIKKAIGFTPLDEGLLAHVFKGGMSRAIDEFPARVILPAPPLLLAMKAASLPGRTRDHKKHKDIMDVYALIWHSGVPINSLRRDVAGLVSGDALARMLSSIDSSDYDRAADALGVDRDGLEKVINDFARGGAGVKESKEWALPANMSYDSLVATVKALHLAGADQKAVVLEKLSKKTGIGTQSTGRGLVFLKSVGIVEATGRGLYSLTPTGAPYAKALMADDASQIARLTADIIGQSHLDELADVIKINKNITRDNLYKRIKAFAGRPDGKGAGNMHPPDAAGATAVLRLFEVAGLLEEAARAPGGKAARGAPGRRGGRHFRQAAAAGAAAGETDDLGVLAVKGVGQVRVNDLETLKVAEMYMDMLRRRLQGGAKGGAAHADAERSPA